MAKWNRNSSACIGKYTFSQKHRELFFKYPAYQIASHKIMFPIPASDQSSAFKDGTFSFQSYILQVGGSLEIPKLRKHYLGNQCLERSLSESRTEHDPKKPMFEETGIAV